MYKRLLVLFGFVVFGLLAGAVFAPQANASAPAQAGNFPALYYNYIDGGGTECPTANAVFSGFDNEIWKYWPEGTSPVPGIVNTNNYMVCWNGSVFFPQAGTYTVYTLNDDGMNVWVNGKIAMNAWYDQGPTWHQGDFNIPAPGVYSFQVKYYNRPNAGIACVSWALKGQPYGWKCPFPPNVNPPPPPVCPGCWPCQGCPPPPPPPQPTPVPPVCPGCWPCQGCPPVVVPTVQPIPPCSWNCYPPPPPPQPKPPKPACWYSIRYGDTLTGIAWRFGVTTWQLQQWNNIPNPNMIYAGMVIRVCPPY